MLRRLPLVTALATATPFPCFSRWIRTDCGYRSNRRRLAVVVVVESTYDRSVYFDGLAPKLGAVTRSSCLRKETEVNMKDREDAGGVVLTGNVGETNSDGDGRTILQVECGMNKAVLHLDKLCQGSKGACVLFDDAWMTPNEFQAASGRELAKDWKRSIKHHDKSLKLLIGKGFLFIDPAVCRCEHCVPSSSSPLTEPPSITASPSETKIPKVCITSLS